MSSQKYSQIVETHPVKTAVFASAPKPLPSSPERALRKSARRISETWGVGRCHEACLLTLQALIAYNACMQYTLRDIPAAVDSELRQRARATGRSLNAVALEVLRRGVGLGDTPIRQRDLTDIAGTWVEDDEFDRAIKSQHRIDRRLWR